VLVKRRSRSLTERVQAARERIRELVEMLREEGLRDEEIRRAFDAEMMFRAEETARR